MHPSLSEQQDNAQHEQHIVCHECDNLVRIPPLEHKQKALCPRCGNQLTQYHLLARERILAFSAAGLIFLILSLPFKFLSFSASGQGQSIGIPDSITILLDQGYPALALILAAAIVVLPAMVLAGLLYLLVPLHFGGYPPQGVRIFRVVHALLPWSMAEIFLVGVLVSLIKISDLADVQIGASFLAYIAFTLCLIGALLHVDKHQMSRLLKCEQALHHKPLPRTESIQRTWALLFTSLILYIPANALPIMNTRLFGQDDPSTIVGGILLLWQHGSYPIALVIFIASVLVPIGKLVILVWLNFSVQRGTFVKQSERMFWYRVTEFIGRWSMVDVFVVAILVSLIQLGNTMSIYPGPAALAFCAVVIMTMLAAMTFDTRLIWKQKNQHE